MPKGQLTSDPHTMDARLRVNPQFHYGINGAGQTTRAGEDDRLRYLSQEEQECLQFFEDTIDSLEESLEDNERRTRVRTLVSSSPIHEVDGPRTSSLNPTAIIPPSPQDQDIIDLVQPKPDLVQTREQVFSPVIPDFQTMVPPPVRHYENKPRHDASEYNPPLPGSTYGSAESHPSYHPPGSIPTPVLIAQKIAENQAGGTTDVGPSSLPRCRSFEREKAERFCENDQAVKPGPPTFLKPSLLPPNISLIMGNKEHHQSLPNVSIEERRAQMLANLSGTSHHLLPGDSKQGEKTRNIATRSISFRDPTPDRSRMEALSKLGLTRNRALSGGMSVLVNPDPSPPPSISAETSSRSPVANIPTPAQTIYERPVASVPIPAETSNKVPVASVPTPAETSTKPPVASVPRASETRLPVASVPTPAETSTKLPVASGPTPAETSTKLPVASVPTPAETSTKLPVASVPRPAEALYERRVASVPRPAETSTRLPVASVPTQTDISIKPPVMSVPISPQIHKKPDTVLTNSTSSFKVKPPQLSPLSPAAQQVRHYPSPPISPPPEVEFNSYGGKSIMVNHLVSTKSENVSVPSSPDSHSLPPALANPSDFNSYGGKSKVMALAPVAMSRTDLPDILSSHIDKSQTILPPAKSETLPIERNSYGGKSRSINPSTGLSASTRAPKAPAPTPAPKPARHSYHGGFSPQRAAVSAASPEQKRRSVSKPAMFRPQGITVQFSGRGATDESRREALRKLGLLKHS
ncbi:uncharacterized protein proser2 [Genypterus blacodes]|uniref:uncharacterized protein proser2 n=1 Tax=Genypterus blacodes TaxID=154954 RepID=UPI003F772079